MKQKCFENFSKKEKEKRNASKKKKNVQFDWWVRFLLTGLAYNNTYNIT